MAAATEVAADEEVLNDLSLESVLHATSQDTEPLSALNAVKPQACVGEDKLDR